MASKGLTQAYQMQDFAFNASMALREKMSDAFGVKAPDKEQAAIIAQLGKVWSDAQERVRIHRGKPLPGSMSYEKVKRTRPAKLASAGAGWLDNVAATHAEQPEPADNIAGQAEQPTQVHASNVAEQPPQAEQQA